jgi:ribosomal protein S27E
MSEPIDLACSKCGSTVWQYLYERLILMEHTEFIEDFDTDVKALDLAIQCSKCYNEKHIWIKVAT